MASKQIIVGALLAGIFAIGQGELIESRQLIDSTDKNSSAGFFPEDFSVQVNQTRDKFSRALFHRESNELESFDIVARSLTGIVGRNENDAAIARLGEILGLKGLTHIHIIKWGLILLAVTIPLLITFIPLAQAKVYHFVEENPFADMTTHLTRNVFSSEHCVERMSCELGRANHGNFLDRFINKMIHHIGRYMPIFFRPAVSAYLDRTYCKKYNCGLMDRLLFGQPHFVPPPPPPPPPHFHRE